MDEWGDDWKGYWKERQKDPTQRRLIRQEKSEARRRHHKRERLKEKRHLKENQKMEEFTLFWDGPLSQWELSLFTIDDIEYNCAEQFMMAEKARFFEDKETFEKIMEAETPALQKKLGREVLPFEKDDWQETEENGRPRCWNIVWRGNMAKFSQNPHLLRDLIDTKGTTLAEASPHDFIWGIGFHMNSAGARQRISWRGKNWLGEVLTSVRDFLDIDARIYNSSSDERLP